MTMWIVGLYKEWNHSYQYEYYTNKDAAETRANYFKARGLDAWAAEEEILDAPRQGAPDGYYMWDGQVVNEKEGK